MLLPYIKLPTKNESLPAWFLHNIWRKIVLVLYSINWPSFIAWLSSLCQILDNLCIVTIYCSVCDVINFEINLKFFIKLFFYITKKSGSYSVMVSLLSILIIFIQLGPNPGSVQVLWQWWGSLTMVKEGNKARCLSSVNHTTKAIHHHHHHHHHHHYNHRCIYFQNNESFSHEIRSVYKRNLSETWDWIFNI